MAAGARCPAWPFHGSRRATFLTRARMTAVEDPIGRILEDRRGRRGVEPMAVPDSTVHEHADFE